MFARNTNTSIDGEENAGTVDLFRVVALYTIRDTRVADCVRLASANTLLLAIIAATECFILFSILQRFLNMQLRWKNIQPRTFYGFYKFITAALLSSVWQIALISVLRSVARTILLILWKVYDTFHRALIFSNVYRFLYFTSSSLRSACCSSYHLGYSATNVSGNNEIFLTRFCSYYFSRCPETAKICITRFLSINLYIV